MNRKLFTLISLVIVFSLSLSACANVEENTILASGTLSAIEASISPELSGRVEIINVVEGDHVTKGQVLFTINEDVYRAQLEQAIAAVEAAEALIETARLQAESADAQYQLTLQGALMQEMTANQDQWSTSIVNDYRPAWYFNKVELIEAAKIMVANSETTLENALLDLENEQNKANSKEFIATENRLALAQIALSVANQTITQAQTSRNTDMQDAAEELKNKAQAEFDAALSDYQRMLTTNTADSILKARARVAVAQTSLDNAREKLLALQTGDQSLQVIAAHKAFLAAESMVKQAQAGFIQAQEAQNLAILQLDRTKIVAPMDGIILSRNLEVGELVAAGGTVLRLAQIETLNLTVYLPEDIYGRVNIGDQVKIWVDAYKETTFVGSIISIADEAEFTPRNVQTEDGRKATVYAVKIRVQNPDQKLKPGMPADVEFSLH